LFAAAAFIVFYSVDNVADSYRGQYRFIICNKTGLTLNKIEIQSHDIATFNNLLADKTTKLCLNYWEGNNFNLITQFSDKVDTTYLPVGGTNSIGYIYNLDIKLKDNKIIAEIDNGKKCSP
jgi:hypothetical protein